jgi:hypothetical protein
MKIESPLIVVFENDGKVQTHLYPGKWGYKEYGIVIADVVRHVANAFKVYENDVWEWVDKERDAPTSPAIEIKPS